MATCFQRMPSFDVCAHLCIYVRSLLLELGLFYLLCMCFQRIPSFDVCAHLCRIHIEFILILLHVRSLLLELGLLYLLLGRFALFIQRMLSFDVCTHLCINM